MQERIIVRNARTHNLKNVTVEMPRNKMIVFTGLSGSGKSSLAFDTIFAEGQRRYIESLSAYARQFLHQMQKPDVEEIIGLSPAISIDQKSSSRNPRSTVATVTEIYDYLRILYARVGRAYCPQDHTPIRRMSNEEVQRTVMAALNLGRALRANREVMGVPLHDAKLKVYAPVVVGRKGEHYQLLYDLLSKGYETVRVDGKDCSLREKIILDKNRAHSIDVLVDEWYVTEFKEHKRDAEERLAEAIETSLHEADGLVKVILPDGEEKIFSSKFICPRDGTSFPEIEPRLFSFNSPYGACAECNGLGVVGVLQDEVCPACHGARLRPEALHVYLGGEKWGEGKTIVEFTAMTIGEAKEFLEQLSLSPVEKEISATLLKEIRSRLQFMMDVGLEYLTLDRKANTLSGGEAQRIRLASQLGSGLVGALYVLDEPTIGLHQKDNDRLIRTLLHLRDLGNTIIVVEHDEDTIYAADYLVDIGPGAGVHGGEIVVADYLEKLLTAKRNTSKSLTLAYLRGERRIAVPEKRRTEEAGWLRIRGASIHNIKDMNVDIPLGRFNVITGVSGSGKSSLMYEVLHRNLLGRLEKRYRTATLFHCASMTGTEYLRRVVLIDQSPIGRTPRSNPATYTGAFTFIRELFAQTEEARARGWRPGRFSFNVKGGRCEACQGNGVLAVEMHFLPTVYITCDVCGGKRFMKETLEVRYKKKNIHEVLEMTVEEACAFFSDIPAIIDRLGALRAVGLGYVKLGQSATTLSGGEAQRVKIASELYRPHTQKTIYLLDEPTIGLHYEDVRTLITILQSLVDRGNTVVMIEHHMDVIKSADYVIDIGPGGGVHGGRVVVQGTPEKVAACRASATGKYLKRVLARG